VASLGLVSPGAANDGVTPIFFLKKTDDLFLLITICKVMTFSAVRPRLFTVLSKFSHIFKFYSSVTPWRVSSGAVLAMSEMSVRLSFCLSVCLSNAWVVTKRKKTYVHILIPRERSMHLILWHEKLLMLPNCLKFWTKVTPSFQKRRFSIYVRS